MKALGDGSLEPRPEFQRRLVWTNAHKEEFLKTVLMNYPFPEIYVAAGEVNADTAEGIEMLVDGQQRVTTLYQYFTGADTLTLKNLTPYQKLTNDEKMAFLEYEVVVRDLGNKSIEEIKEVFQRINSTKYSLNAMEVHNARFDGELKKFTEKLAQHDFFNDHNIFKTNDIRRMGDLVFCLNVVITILGGYFNRDDEQEEFLSKYNDEFPYAEDLKLGFDSVFKLINACNFSPKCRVWRKADLFTLIIEMYVALVKKDLALDAEKLTHNLLSFYEVVDTMKLESDNAMLPDETEKRLAQIYYRAVSGGTNDRSNRIRRGEIISRLIDECV